MRVQSGGSALLTTRTPRTSGRAARRSCVALMAGRHLCHASPASEGATPTGRACAQRRRMARTLAVQLQANGREEGSQAGQGRAQPRPPGAALYDNMCVAPV